MPVKTESKQVMKRVTVVDKHYVCDRCGKELECDHFFDDVKGGGYFTPSFPWGSRFCDSAYEKEVVVLCDDCWNCFYDSFVFDHIKHNQDAQEENDVEIFGMAG